MSSETQKLSRRAILGTIGGLIGGLAVGSALGWTAKPEAPARTVTVGAGERTVTATVTQAGATVQRTITQTQYVTAQPREKVPVTVIAFAQGFAWPELFGADGTIETDLLKRVEGREAVDVSIEWGDEWAVREKVASDVTARVGKYDIVLVGSDGAVQAYGYAGYLEPLDEYFVKYPQDYFDPEDVYKSFLDANRIEGTLYALPYYSFGPGIIYRRDLFDKYDAGLPKDTWKTDDLEIALEKISEGLKRDGITDTYALTMRAGPGEEPTLDLAGFIYAYAGYPAWFEGGAIWPGEIKQNQAKPIFDSSDFEAGFRAFTSWVKSFGPPGASTHTWVDMMNIYAQGKAAVLMPSAINGYAALGITQDDNVKRYTKFMLTPFGPGGKRINSYWTFSLGINKFSKNKEAAWRVLTYLTGRSSMQAFAERTMWPNVTMRSVLYSYPLIKKYGIEEIELNERSVLENPAIYFPYIPELDLFMDKIGTMASDVVAGSKGTDAALSELQRWALDLMRSRGYYR
ncbi:MAG: extracellular solute-binding protein [Aigarchaeota archaeon]|nr:extracellular solute-binding protein [Candidatus Calditenuaceae archaeon]MDW8022070.1 extracellular solute-binding protein [Nitrososphaerota archaeon]